MANKIEKAFAPICATDALKENTCAFLKVELARRRRKAPTPIIYMAACCAALMLIVGGAGGYHLYTTPVSYISIDVNPSVELGLNRMDFVVTAQAYNDEGAVVLENLSLKNKPYIQAVELLLADETIGSYLSTDGQISFTVVSDKQETLLAGIQTCQGYAQSGAQCHGASTATVNDARGSGLSFGKYQAFLELSRYDETITPEDCKHLSMRQIRDRINSYSGEPTIPTQGQGQCGSNHREDEQGCGGYHGGRG